MWECTALLSSMLFLVVRLCCSWLWERQVANGTVLYAVGFSCPTTKWSKNFGATGRMPCPSSNNREENRMIVKLKKKNNGADRQWPSLCDAIHLGSRINCLSQSKSHFLFCCVWRCSVCWSKDGRNDLMRAMESGRDQLELVWQQNWWASLHPPTCLLLRI